MSLQYHQHVSNLINLYFTLAAEAEASRPRAHLAAFRIQQYWKRFIKNKWTLYRTKLIIRVQRRWRGFAIRKGIEHRVLLRDKERRMTEYGKRAIMIQKVWRGWRSRRIYGKQQSPSTSASYRQDGLRAHDQSRRFL